MYKASHSGTIMRVIVIVLVVLAIGFFGNIYNENLKYTQAYNRGIQKMNKGHHGDAAVYFEGLYARHSDNPERAASIKAQIVTCYRVKAADPLLTTKQQQVMILSIQKLDPSLLTDKEKKLLKLKL